MNKTFKPSLSALLLGSAIAASSGSAAAYNLVDNNGTELNLDVEIIVGQFRSGETYGNPESTPSWTEAYAKYGFSGSKQLGTGSLFGAVNAVTSGTWGDGDALGVTTGDERETDPEDLYIGYRTEMFEISAGRQNITIGDGFILNGDALNLGAGAGPDELDRGGRLLAGRPQSFR